MAEEIFKHWKKYAEKEEENNYRFIRSLKFKNQKKVDSLAENLHKKAFNKIDCLDCGNCCKTSKPLIEEDDIKEISEFLNISRNQVISDYLEKDSDGDWTINILPCPFLNEADNKCKIYSARPKDCREFPHTNKKGFASRSFMHSANTIECPAVYYIVEQMKGLI